jgi:hypothetical protein
MVKVGVGFGLTKSNEVLSKKNMKIVYLQPGLEELGWKRILPNQVGEKLCPKNI